MSRVLVVSHSVLVRTQDSWRTKNRVAAVADGLVNLGWNVSMLSLVQNEAEFASRELSREVNVVPLTRNVRGALDALRLARSTDAALVFMPTIRSALLAILLGRRAVVYWGNAWALIPGSSRTRRLLERFVVRRAGHVVAAGEAVREAFADLGDPTLCVPLVPPEVAQRIRAVDPDKDPTPLRTLFVGTIIARKGVPELLEAARSLPDVQFRFVGPVADANLDDRLRDAERELRNVRTSGYAEWEELREAYVWANVLVHPSHLEGFPRVIYEAAAFGNAIITTAVGGIPALLRDGQDALFVPVGDSKALASAIRMLADEPTAVTRLARAVRRALGPVFVDDDPVTQFDRHLRERVETLGTRRRLRPSGMVSG